MEPRGFRRGSRETQKGAHACNINIQFPYWPAGGCLISAGYCGKKTLFSAANLARRRFRIGRLFFPREGLSNPYAIFNPGQTLCHGNRQETPQKNGRCDSHSSWLDMDLSRSLVATAAWWFWSTGRYTRIRKCQHWTIYQHDWFAANDHQSFAWRRTLAPSKVRFWTCLEVVVKLRVSIVPKSSQMSSDEESPSRQNNVVHGNSCLGLYKLMMHDLLTHFVHLWEF